MTRSEADLASAVAIGLLLSGRGQRWLALVATRPRGVAPRLAPSATKRWSQYRNFLSNLDCELSNRVHTQATTIGELRATRWRDAGMRSTSAPVPIFSTDRTLDGKCLPLSTALDVIEAQSPHSHLFCLPPPGLWIFHRGEALGGTWLWRRSVEPS